MGGRGGGVSPRTPATMGIAGTRIVAAATAALAAAGLALPRQLEPGDRIGGMPLVQMAYDDSIPSIFPACEPLILRPGLYHRHCTVRQTRRLFIGYGDFRATRPALDRAWRRERWRLRVDGHEVRLAAFGTDDRTLLNYPPGRIGTRCCASGVSCSSTRPAAGT